MGVYAHVHLKGGKIAVLYTNREKKELGREKDRENELRGWSGLKPMNRKRKVRTGIW